MFLQKQLLSMLKFLINEVNTQICACVDLQKKHVQLLNILLKFLYHLLPLKFHILVCGC